MVSWKDFQFIFEEKGEKEENSIKKARIEIYKNLKIERGKKRISGIYWLINNKNQTLYIGKGKDIADRMLSHYKAFLGIKQPNAWTNFFSKVKGRVIIRWIEIDHEDDYVGETLRIIIERLLTNKLKIETNGREPLFEAEHSSIK